MLRLLQGDGVFGQTDAASDLNETEGLQEEGLETARFLHLLLGHGRKMLQLSHQQRVLCRERAVLLQDLSKVAAAEKKQTKNFQVEMIRIGCLAAIGFKIKLSIWVKLEYIL